MPEVSVVLRQDITPSAGLLFIDMSPHPYHMWIGPKNYYKMDEAC